MTFEVGDRVVMTERVDGFFSPLPATVVKHPGRSYMHCLLVEFPEEVAAGENELHNGDLNRWPRSGRCWYVPPSLLKIASAQLELFQEGDLQ